MTEPASLSPAQLEIMGVIWDRGEATVGEVREALSSRRGITRNTIQTTMTRLEDKGWLEHRIVGQTFHYRAVQPRSATLGSLVSRLVDTAFNGSAEGLVLALLQGRGLTDNEERRIRAMIDATDTKRSTATEDGNHDDAS